MGFVVVTSPARADEIVTADQGTGAQLFFGKRALVGRLAGDELLLPADSTACANCHTEGVGPAGRGGARFGPVIQRGALMVSAPRRGGPPSRYDLSRFCRLLRTGVDAAEVMIARAMPRYAISDAECGSLWTYLNADPA